MLLLLAAIAQSGIDNAAPVNVQLYPCSKGAERRQTWRFNKAGGNVVFTAGAEEAESSLQLQWPESPSNATTCRNPGASCFNLIIGSSSAAAPAALEFALDSHGGHLVVAAPSSPPFLGLCVASDWAGSHGYLPNVYLTECVHAEETWAFKPSAANGSVGQLISTEGSSSTVMSTNLQSQCLDVGSGGSAGDLGFRLKVAPAAVPAKQAFNSSAYASWGGE